MATRKGHVFTREESSRGGKKGAAASPLTPEERMKGVWASVAKRQEMNPRPSHCVVCGVEMTTRYQYRHGTGRYGQMHQGKGKCKSCSDKEYKAWRKAQDPDREIRQHPPAACVMCGTPLRTRGQPKTEGTSLHRGHGLCNVCYQREERKARKILRLMGMM